MTNGTQFKKLPRLSSEENAEFIRMNTMYNNKAVTLASLMTVLFMSISMIAAYLSYELDPAGAREFWYVLPYHIACIVISAIVLIVMVILRKKKLSHLMISDIVALVQVFMILGFLLASSHVEIPVIGIKNINAIIIYMIIVGLLLRFQIVITMALEVLISATTIIMLIYEKNDISNFYASLINLLSTTVVAVVTAFIYWDLRKENYISIKKLEYLASSDGLTRLNNRRSFDVYIEREWQQVKNDDLSIALLFIDVDYFKRFNDIYGHAEGDKCLRAVADVISASIRKSDFAARYGGEEFIVSMTGINSENAKRIAFTMLEALRELNMPHSDSVAPYVTISIGCMICHPGQPGAVSMSKFIEMADSAMYMAKNQGRNRFIIHPESSDKQ